MIEGIDQIFAFCHEKIPGKGEDSLCYSFNENAGVIGVFDGCGGLGAATYEKLGNHTGAYFASRAASTATMQWFEQTDDYRKLRLDDLKDELDWLFSLCKKAADYKTPKLQGTMVRPFPTTMAVWLIGRHDNVLRAVSISAGDSRTYLMDEEGLAQISQDDIEGEDAMSNIYNDGAMTNVLAADGDYNLSTAGCDLPHPCVLLAATDGCFGYVQSPMEFEYLLLKTLMDSQNIDQWNQKLQDAIDEIAGDDQTMAVIIIGYGTLERLQATMLKRLKEMESRINSLGDGRSSRQEWWESYKAGYYRYAKGGIPAVE